MEAALSRRNVKTATSLHPAVFGALVFCMLWSLAAIWLFFGTNTYTGLQLAVSTFFGVVFVIVPLWLLKLTKKRNPPAPAFGEWARGELEILSGTIDAKHAAAMVLIAPVAVTAGLTAVGFVAWLAATGAI